MQTIQLRITGPTRDGRWYESAWTDARECEQTRIVRRLLQSENTEGVIIKRLGDSPSDTFNAEYRIKGE